MSLIMENYVHTVALRLLEIRAKIIKIIFQQIIIINKHMYAESNERGIHRVGGMAPL